MNNIQYTCMPDRRRIWPVILLAFLAAVLAITLLQLGYGNQLLLQLVMVFSLCSVVYLFVRHMAVSFCYATVEEADMLYFTVTQKQGRRSMLQCKLSLDGLCAVQHVDAEHPFSAEKVNKVHRFSPLFFPDEYDVLYFSAEGQQIAVKINAEPAFLTALLSLAESVHQNDATQKEDTSDL